MKRIITSVLILVLTVLVSLTASAYTKVYIDGSEVPFSDSTGYPIVDNGRTLVPVRFIADCFGVDVKWMPEYQRVVLTSK